MAAGGWLRAWSGLVAAAAVVVVGVGLALGGGGRYVVVDGERCAIILVAGSRRAGGAAGRLGVSGTFSKGGRHQSRERRR